MPLGSTRICISWRKAKPLATFVSEQASQDDSADILLVLSQCAIDSSLLDCRQTMSKCILVSRWARFAAYACHTLSLAQDQTFSLGLR